MCSKVKGGRGEGGGHSRERAPIGRSPYKSAKQGVGTLLSVSAFNYERAPMLKHIIGQIIMYSGITTDFEVES